MKLFAITAAALLLSGTAGADTYTEQGDAGQTLATAAATGSSGAPSTLTSIAGSYGDVDADLYQIYISNPSAFSASTVNAGTSEVLDTELFLLDASGHAIAVNDDDASGLSVDSTLPVGDGHYAGLLAGTYYLGIADSGNEPVNLNNQLLFAMGLGTSVRGAASGLNPTTFNNFNGNTYESVEGPYVIDLTGVTTGPATTGAVPEPASWALMIAGFGAIGTALRQRRRTHPRTA